MQAATTVVAVAALAALAAGQDMVTDATTEMVARRHAPARMLLGWRPV